MARQSAEHARRALERWRDTPIGRYVLGTENTVLADGLEGLYGSFGLQCGAGRVAVCSRSRTTNCTAATSSHLQRWVPRAWLMCGPIPIIYP